jgi:hypothetical protein
VKLTQLLEVSKEMDREWPGLVSNYSKKLVEVYYKDGYWGKAKDELFTYITEYNRGDIEAFHDLKNRYDEEVWLRKREEVFNVLAEKRIDIKPLLAFEGLKDRLYDLLTTKINNDHGFAKFNIMEIGKYESVLRPEYDDKLLDLYVKLIWDTSEFAGGRPHYQEIVGFMRRMFDYPGGKERAKDMFERFQLRYSNRPAMMEELQVLYRDI